MLGEVDKEIKSRYFDSLRKMLAIEQIPSKISRGENYLGQPYVILDAPNLFSKQNIFAIRNFIWYGNYAASFFMVSGIYLEKIKSDLHTSQTPPDNLFVCINKDPWHHQFTNDNMKLLENPEELITHTDFLKLGIKHPLSDAEELMNNFLSDYEFYLTLIAQA